MKNSKIEAIRNDYSDVGIDFTNLPVEPWSLFSTWFQQAWDAGLAEANGMVIATSSTLGDISQRTVLMKGFDRDGFYFYTNYTSQKARQLDSNPVISCLFPWLTLHRQVAFQGIVEKASEAESARYFASRPRDSQVGAWASRQSDVLENRAVLEARVEKLTSQFSNETIPLPVFWGGYQVKPLRIEFWQGRTSRLHDRLIYSRGDINSTSWSTQQLYP